MGGERRIEDVGGGKRLAVIDSRRDRRQRTPVENSFYLDENRVKGLNVDVVAESKSRKMFLE